MTCQLSYIIKSPHFPLYKSEGITLIQGDFFRLTKDILGKVNAVYDRAALIALEEGLRAQYAAHLIELLGQNTDIFLITTAYDEHEMQGPPFSVDDKEVKRLYGNNCHIKQLLLQADVKNLRASLQQRVKACD